MNTAVEKRVRPTCYLRGGKLALIAGQVLATEDSLVAAIEGALKSLEIANQVRGAVCAVSLFVSDDPCTLGTALRTRFAPVDPQSGVCCKRSIRECRSRRPPFESSLSVCAGYAGRHNHRSDEKIRKLKSRTPPIELLRFCRSLVFGDADGDNAHIGI